MFEVRARYPMRLFPEMDDALIKVMCSPPDRSRKHGEGDRELVWRVGNIDAARACVRLLNKRENVRASLREAMTQQETNP